jgi:hypothetical protein
MQCPTAVLRQPGSTCALVAQNMGRATESCLRVNYKVSASDQGLNLTSAALLYFISVQEILFPLSSTCNAPTCVRYSLPPLPASFCIHLFRLQDYWENVQ